MAVEGVTRGEAWGGAHQEYQRGATPSWQRSGQPWVDMTKLRNYKRIPAIGEHLGREILQVQGDDGCHFRPNRRRELVSVIRVGQMQSLPKMFKCGNDRVAEGVLPPGERFAQGWQVAAAMGLGLVDVFGA